jgi:hypothetical protein
VRPVRPGRELALQHGVRNPGHCLAYSPVELNDCERHPGEYNGRGYCNPLGEPTWPTHCVDGFEP